MQDAICYTSYRCEPCISSIPCEVARRFFHWAVSAVAIVDPFVLSNVYPSILAHGSWFLPTSRASIPYLSALHGLWLLCGHGRLCTCKMRPESRVVKLKIHLIHKDFAFILEIEEIDNINGPSCWLIGNRLVKRKWKHVKLSCRSDK